MEDAKEKDRRLGGPFFCRNGLCWHRLGLETNEVYRQSRPSSSIYGLAQFETDPLPIVAFS